jgi:hypothetical protein
MNTKSHPQNSGISQAVVDGRIRPSTLPRRPWCQGYGNVLGRWCLFTTAHAMGRRLSNASPTPWSRVKSQVVFLAGTGNRNSGVFRWFWSNSEEYTSSQKEVPVKKFLRKKQESQGIRRNPGRNEKQSPRNGHSWNIKMQPRLCWAVVVQ